MKKEEILQMFVQEWTEGAPPSKLMDRRISKSSGLNMHHLSIYRPIEIDKKVYHPAIKIQSDCIADLTFTDQYGLYKKANSTCDIKDKANCSFEQVDFEKLSSISDEIYL
jgi:hypothetical protein